MRELLYAPSVGIHSVDIEVTIARGGENDVLAIACDGGFGVVAVLGGKWTQVTAIRPRCVYPVGIVDRPDIAK